MTVKWSDYKQSMRYVCFPQFWYGNLLISSTHNGFNCVLIDSKPNANTGFTLYNKVLIHLIIWMQMNNNTNRFKSGANTRQLHKKCQRNSLNPGKKDANDVRVASKLKCCVNCMPKWNCVESNLCLTRSSKNHLQQCSRRSGENRMVKKNNRPERKKSLSLRMKTFNCYACIIRNDTLFFRSARMLDPHNGSVYVRLNGAR